MATSNNVLSIEVLPALSVRCNVPLPQVAPQSPSSSSSPSTSSSSSLGSMLLAGSSESQGVVLGLLADIAARSETKTRSSTRRRHKKRSHKKSCKKAHKKSSEKTEEAKDESVVERKRKRGSSTKNVTSKKQKKLSEGHKRRRDVKGESATAPKEIIVEIVASTLNNDDNDHLGQEAPEQIEVEQLVEQVVIEQLELDRVESEEMLTLLREFERLVDEGVVPPPIGQQVVDEELEELRLQQFAMSYVHRGEDDFLTDLLSDSPLSSPTISRRGREPPVLPSFRSFLKGCTHQNHTPLGSSSSLALSMSLEEDKAAYYDEEVLLTSFDLLPAEGDDSE